MTGYESKRAAARDKLVDDRRAYYEKFDDLYAVYLNGVYDGKKAAQPAQEPVAFYNPQHGGFYWAKPTTISAPQAVDIVPLALYTTPPQRTWVGLTDEDEIDWEDGGNLKDLVKAIEAKLKEKNT